MRSSTLGAALDIRADGRHPNPHWPRHDDGASLACSSYGGSNNRRTVEADRATSREKTGHLGAEGARKKPDDFPEATLVSHMGAVTTSVDVLTWGVPCVPNPVRAA